MNSNRSTDILVIGGGIIGMAVAYGLARSGERVKVLDQGDDVFRAARGNFGLVWVQGKGAGQIDYARWTLGSATMWPAFAAELTERTGVDLELSQIGGLRLALDDSELARQAQGMHLIQNSIGRPYPYEQLTAKEVKGLIPEVGPDVVGAIYSPMDGHVSPLRLLRALVQAYSALGGELHSNEGVEEIQHVDGEFRVRSTKRSYSCGRVVLAAGLGNLPLAPQIGLEAPVKPERGQVIVTERLRPFLRYPTMYVRQTGEGVIQLGDSKEDVGFNDGTTTNELSRIAGNAARYFPLLGNVNIVRSWGALRVMTPDGYPLYESSRQCPGAYLVTCHSGITLAANHANQIADWVRGVSLPIGIQTFKSDRFHVQTTVR
jgi:glycine/D-amino acid oxidase-like deaminating enzyme